MAWRLQLLGAPRAESEDGFHDLPLNKPASLLYYLAQRGDWVSRSELAFLYRPDVPEDLALHTVRKLLHRARKHPWANALEVETRRLRFAVRTDVQDCQQALERGDWQAALEGYRGEFLQGLTITEESYQAWLELERQSLEQQWRLAAVKLAEALEQRGDHTEAARWLKRLLTRDPLDEETLQAYMRVLHAAGKRKEALEAYQRFRQDLFQELEVEPLETTQALLDAIRQTEHPSEKAPSARPKHNLPTPSTRFIGRRRELGQLATRLAEPDTRLLTLVGLGGVGKTRLALELAWQQLESFPDGVFFAPLAGVTSADLLVPSIARAVGLGFSGAGDAKQQLTDFLREKQLLLVLDNFEHLLEGAPLLMAWLEDAAKLTLLVTSRSALNLQSETLFDLDGLAYPEDDSSEAPETFDAVRLFLNRAERVSTGLVLEGATFEAAASISRKVEGLPLALELAATWTRTLSVEEIERKLSEDPGLLSSPLRDLPERHRSILAVFDHTWRQLSEPEQTVLTRLSLFRGGFTLEAAERIAGAHLPLLLSLMNHALVRRSQEGRYGLHELIRQYAASHLEREPQRKPALVTVFSRYYLELLAQNEPDLRGPRHLEIMEMLLKELGNLRLAHTFAMTSSSWQLLDKALSGLRTFYWEANLHAEGNTFFTRLVAAIQADAPLGSLQERLLARALLRLGMFQRDTGLYQEARVNLETSVAALRSLTISDDLARALQLLSTVSRQTGQFAEAERYLEESLELCRTIDDELLRAYTLYSLALLKRELGQYDAARELLETCLAIREQMGDFKGVILITSQLGTLAREVEGNSLKARQYTERALELSRQLRDKKNEAIELNNLATIAFDEGNFEESEGLLKTSLLLKQHLGHVSGQMITLTTLGALHAQQAQYEGAFKYLQQALELARRLGSPRGQVAALAELGETARRQGESAAAASYFTAMLRLAQAADIPPRIILRGLYYLALLHAGQDTAEALLLAEFAQRHPGHLKKTEEQAKKLAAGLKAELPGQTANRLQAEAEALSLEAMLTRQLARLVSDV